jgi:hypothetical protein
MKQTFLNCAAALILLSTPVLAQDKIFRCDKNEYTNNATDAAARGCKLVEGGNVTIVQTQRPVAAPGVRVAAASPNNSSAPRIDSSDQKARDNDAKSILESELKKSESKLSDLVKEYNNGEPDKLGPETRNHQKWLDRVADLKANIARMESDISGIKRELGRASR